MIFIFLVQFHSQRLQGDWEIDTLVNFSNIIAKHNDLSDYWMCHRQPAYTPSLLLQSMLFNHNLTFLSGVSKEFPKSIPLAAGLDPAATLWATFTWPYRLMGLARLRSKLSTIHPHLYISQGGLYLICPVSFLPHYIQHFLKGALQILPFGHQQVKKFMVTKIQAPTIDAHTERRGNSILETSLPTSYIRKGTARAQGCEAGGKPLVFPM